MDSIRVSGRQVLNVAISLSLWFGAIGCCQAQTDGNLRWNRKLQNPLDRVQLQNALMHFSDDPNVGLEPPVFDIDVLIARGDARLVPVLLTIVRDASQYPQPAMRAWNVLIRFNDPAIVKELAEQGRLERVPYRFIEDFIEYQLPSPYELAPGLGGGASDWLTQQLKVNSFEDMILKLLDGFLSQQTPDQDFATYDPRMIRWLNLYAGEDADVVLQRLSPTGKAFRDEQILTRHYDPLIAFREFGLFRDRLAMPDAMTPGKSCLPDETRRRRTAALPLMFDSPQQREVCESMFEALTGPDRPNVTIKDARARTVDWYWKNRDRLHFDPNVGRLTVGKSE